MVVMGFPSYDYKEHPEKATTFVGNIIKILNT